MSDLECEYPDCRGYGTRVVIGITPVRLCVAHERSWWLDPRMLELSNCLDHKTDSLSVMIRISAATGGAPRGAVTEQEIESALQAIKIGRRNVQKCEAQLRELAREWIG